MTAGDFILKLLFLAQTGVGVAGNTLLLSVYAPTSSTAHAPRPTHLILTHMAVANFLVLFFKGIPHTMLIWGITPILGNTGCRLVYYIHRVARGLCLCTTCLLSNFQAITISPRSARRMGLKDRAHKDVSFSCALCWILNLLINTFIPVHIEGLQHIHNSTKIQSYGLCSSKSPRTTDAKLPIILTLPDVVFLVLMARASVFMVLLLYRHRQQVKHIRTQGNFHKVSPEAKATQTILLLASTFILFYSSNSILTIYNVVVLKFYLWLQHTISFLAACYPTLGPLILMLQDPQAPTCCS
ncbi:PREDICTED: vomeronasal type-1 receptor 1-like [Chinchilla lanigera]|uniref:vomeronasal type-1 receptor 1-like n=1 Tax=Chinchilla lanigera TaxID=34839 RepID=UPI00038E9580|nr:PREDICTED: vomeronasal type-1 receptor 1-like [Chinchilla lanigera]